MLDMRAPTDRIASSSRGLAAPTVSTAMEPRARAPAFVPHASLERTPPSAPSAGRASTSTPGCASTTVWPLSEQSSLASALWAVAVTQLQQPLQPQQPQLRLQHRCSEHEDLLSLVGALPPCLLFSGTVKCVQSVTNFFGWVCCVFGAPVRPPALRYCRPPTVQRHDLAPSTLCCLSLS